MNLKAFCALLAGCIVPVLLLVGCYSVPVTGRSALNLVSDEEVARMSAKAFEQIKARHRVSRNAEQTNRVQEVGGRIARIAEADLVHTDWEFVVFQDDSQINAFAMAGGKVGVFSGIFNVIESDEDLAYVLGHEIAHVAARHVHERLSQEMIRQAGGLAAALAVGANAPHTRYAVMNVYGIGTTAGIMMPHNRHMELEADRIGLIYAARAGYDPRGVIDFWERMEGQTGHRHGASAYLSSHPTSRARVEQFRDLMQLAVEEYEANKESQGSESRRSAILREILSSDP